MKKSKNLSIEEMEKNTLTYQAGVFKLAFIEFIKAVLESIKVVRLMNKIEKEIRKWNMNIN